MEAVTISHRRILLIQYFTGWRCERLVLLGRIKWPQINNKPRQKKKKKHLWRVEKATEQNRKNRTTEKTERKKQPTENRGGKYLHRQTIQEARRTRAEQQNRAGWGGGGGWGRGGGRGRGGECWKCKTREETHRRQDGEGAAALCAPKWREMRRNGCGPGGREGRTLCTNTL